MNINSLQVFPQQVDGIVDALVSVRLHVRSGLSAIRFEVPWVVQSKLG